MRVVSPFVGALDGTFFRMGVLPFCVAYVWVLYMVCMSYERFFCFGCCVVWWRACIVGVWFDFLVRFMVEWEVAWVVIIYFVAYVG